ncbi:MAG: 30S ribosomal protein S1 [bacterium]
MKVLVSEKDENKNGNNHAETGQEPEEEVKQDPISEAAEETEPETEPETGEASGEAGEGTSASSLEQDQGAAQDEEEEIEDFGALFEESLKKREFDEGEIIKGTVVDVHKDHIMIDIGGKSEGHVSVDEFKDEEGNVTVEPGQEVEVLVERRNEEDGIIRLSKNKAEKRRVWQDLESSYRSEKPVKGRITERVKGGLMVDIGVMAFLPGSQADIRPIRNLDKLIGEEDWFHIIKFNHKRGNVVVSRRSVMEKDQEDKRSETLASLEKDQVLKGVVKNVTEYGAFINLGGIDGLLHITDMSYGRINHPSEVINVGDEINVKVLRFNPETEKVSLGLKQIMPDPWDNIEKKYPVGTIVSGNVVSVTDYGAFVELEKGVEGLVHVSEMSWSKKRVHPSKVVEPEQEVEAKVLSIDQENRRISLSIKQAEQNPWDLLETNYPVGTKITGKVRNITNFGVFVGVEEGIDGLVHISDLSWTKRVKHPSEVLKKGDDVECMVLKIDKENERFSLGIKQAQPDPWESVPDKYQPGMDVVGTVVNVTDFGVFVELEEGIEGLIHISELSHEKVKDPTEIVEVGREITAEILNVDITERKIRLSVKALEKAEDEASYKKYKKQEGDGTSKLGELIQDKLSQVRVPGVEAEEVSSVEQMGTYDSVSMKSAESEEGDSAAPAEETASSAPSEPEEEKPETSQTAAEKDSEEEKEEPGKEEEREEESDSQPNENQKQE